MNKVKEAMKVLKELCEEQDECDLCPLSTGSNCGVMEDAPYLWDVE